MDSNVILQKKVIYLFFKTLTFFCLFNSLYTYFAYLSRPTLINSLYVILHSLFLGNVVLHFYFICSKKNYAFIILESN